MRFYRFLPFLALLFCSAPAIYAYTTTDSDDITSAADSVWFGRIATATAATDTIWIKAASGHPLILLSARIIARHGDFSILSAPAFPALVTDSVAVVVRYSSRHNVRRDGVLFLRVDDPSQYSIAVRLAGESFYTDPAYDFTDNLQGKLLVDALHSYVQGHTALTYNQARDQMFGTIDKRPGDTLECPYSGKKILAVNRTEAQSKNFNTEHTWPQSVGAENEPPKSDMYHLRATDLTINDKRANYPFGYVVSNVSYEQGGSRLGKDANGATVFEVRDRYKGDVARGMFYFAVCYSNPTSYLNQQEAALRQWSAIDTVDAEESTRNAAIAQWQKRRNPFIDHPEFMERIYSLSGSADFPRIANPVAADTVLVLELSSGRDELPVLFGNSGTDTAFVRSVEVQQSSGTASNLVVGVDSVLAPDGFARITVARPVSATASDSMKVLVKFAQGVPQKVVTVRFAGVTAVEEISRREGVLQAVPNPFREETVIAVPALLSCAEPVVRIVSPIGSEVENIHVAVERGETTKVHVLRLSAVASGLYFCRIYCGDRVFVLPLYLAQ